jgi:sucrose phosphorylase
MLNKYPDYRIVCVDCLTYAGNLSTLEEALKKPVVARQLELLRFRSTCPAFAKESRIMINSDGNKMEFTWENDGYQAKLMADLKTFEFVITETAPDGQTRTL